MALPPRWQGLHHKTVKPHVALKDIEEGYNVIFKANPGLTDTDKVIIKGRVFKIKEIRKLIKEGVIKIQPTK